MKVKSNKENPNDKLNGANKVAIKNKKNTTRASEASQKPKHLKQDHRITSAVASAVA